MTSKVPFLLTHTSTTCAYTLLEPKMSSRQRLILHHVTWPRFPWLISGCRVSRDTDTTMEIMSWKWIYSNWARLLGKCTWENASGSGSVENTTFDSCTGEASQQTFSRVNCAQRPIYSSEVKLKCFFSTGEGRQLLFSITVVMFQNDDASLLCKAHGFPKSRSRILFILP